MDETAGTASAIAAGGNHTLAIAVPPPSLIEIDVRPGIDANRIRSSSRALIPVAILGSEDFAVDDVDPIDARVRAGWSGSCASRPPVART